jgi:putative transposase
MREIQGHLEELYGVNVSPDLISTVTDAVFEEVTQWQQRPLDRLYPVVMFDCLRVKIRDEGVVKSKAVYVVLGVTHEGTKDVLGLWIEQTEGAAFWLRVMSEIKNRGHFPNDEAATRLLYLALRNIISKWKNAAPGWQAALTHFSIIFGDRFALED